MYVGMHVYVNDFFNAAYEAMVVRELVEFLLLVVVASMLLISL